MTIATQDRRPKGKSAFGRRKIVEAGFVRNACSSALPSAPGGRAWIASSVKSYVGVLGHASVVAFERGSILERIRDSAFRGSELKSIIIPSSVFVLGKESFRGCWSLKSVTFERCSRLERIEEFAFGESGLESIEIPSSVVVLSKKCFGWCRSLESVRFENGSRLERIEAFAFSQSGLRSIMIPGSVTFISGSAFSGLRFLTSVSLSPDNTRFRLRECFLEDCDSIVPLCS
jgi:hypothetical protein